VLFDDLFFRAVSILLTKIEINSLHSVIPLSTSYYLLTSLIPFHFLIIHFLLYVMHFFYSQK